MTIFNKLSKNPAAITPEDINQWILPEVLSYFEPKFSYYAFTAYGQSNDVSRSAFKELAIETLNLGLNSFFIKSQHWRSGRKVQPYLVTCLKRLAINEKKDLSSQIKVSVPICPACKSFNSREFLVYDSGKLICHVCLTDIERLEDTLKKENSISSKIKLEYELRLRRIFSNHSRKGYRCPDCARFIPSSYIDNNNVSCPYDLLGCQWFGSIDELQIMSHPLGMSTKHNLSLNSPVKSKYDNEIEHQDLIEGSEIRADSKIELEQSFAKEIQILQEVLNIQHDRILSENLEKNIKKSLMYEAFKNMLKKHPEDMVSYLVRQNHDADLPIQARIFQEFINIVEDSLPLKVIYKGEIAEIYSLLDPRLDLFTGLSEFESYVKHDGTIPNMTEEFYVGGRLMQHSSRCFIGKLIDIKTEDGDQSLASMVDFYTFSYIKMSNDVPIGTKVKVKHFRIPGHYEMNGLILLQRSRRRIVDSIYQRIHGKKRQIHS